MASSRFEHGVPIWRLFQLDELSNIRIFFYYLYLSNRKDDQCMHDLDVRKLD
jgi:hypothetical protein